VVGVIRADEVIVPEQDAAHLPPPLAPPPLSSKRRILNKLTLGLDFVSSLPENHKHMAL
jgi:hypothetical protein